MVRLIVTEVDGKIETHGDPLNIGAKRLHITENLVTFLTID